MRKIAIIGQRLKIKYISIYIISLIYYFLFYNHGINLWDEGIAANGALRTLRGEVVNIDFLGYAPGRYYLFAMAYYFFGISILSIRKVMVIFTAFMPICTYLISKDLMDRYFAVLSFFLILSSPSVYYSRFFPLLTIINLYFLIKYFKFPRKKNFFPLLISIGLSLLFKFEIGIISIFCLVVTSIIKKIFLDKKGFSILFVCLNIALPLIILLFVLYNFQPEQLIFFIKYKLYSIFILHRKWGNPFPNLFPIKIDSFLAFFQFLESLLYYILIPVYAFFLFISLKKIKSSNRFYLNIFIISLFGLTTFSLVLWRLGFDNLVRVLPAFYILLCFSFSKCLNRINVFLNKFNINSVWKFPRKIFFYVLISVLPLLLIGNFLLNHGFYVGSIGVLKEDSKLLNIKRAEVYVPLKVAEWIENITGYINNNSEKKDSIFVLPLNPFWYFLTDRNNPTFYEWILPGSLQHSKKEQKAIIDILKIKKPKIVIVSNISIDGKKERKVSYYSKYLYEYIMKTYDVEKIVGVFQLMKLNNANEYD